MKDAFSQWWKNYRERRGARRRSGKMSRLAHGRTHHHTSFARARFGRMEKRRRWGQWLRRALLVAGAIALCWVLWQSWIGLGVFNY